MSDRGSDTIGKYRVIAQLGLGGMARVLLVMVTGPADVHKLLVLKELREEYAQDPEFVTMFLDEARLAARLSHPNVVHTYEVFEEGDRSFIAMDYLEGQPLHRVIHRVGRAMMPLELHLRILAEVLAGLEYAHSLSDFDGTPLNVVHRDVSPQNVFVTYDGQVKLVDFGIAKAAGSAAFTREGVLKGKVAYIAPEQAQGETVDRRADIFSVGVMLWEALAGRRLTRAQTELVALSHRISGMEPKISEVASDLPEPLVAMCDKAMALEPAERFATAAEFQEAIEDYLDGTGRRIGAKEIASLMGKAFSEERQTIRTLVEQQVKRVREASSGDVARLPVIEIQPWDPSTADSAHGSDDERAQEGDVVLVDGRQVTLATLVSPDGEGSGPRTDPAKSRPLAGSHRELEDDEPSGANSTQKRMSAAASIVPEPESPAGSGRRWLAIAAVALLAAGGALALVYDGGSRTGADGADGAPQRGGSPAAQPPATASATASGTASTDTVRVSLRVTPKDATITIDGAAVTQNPFDVTVPRDSTMHRVRVSADGYVSVDQLVSYERDVTLDITLVAEEPAATTAEPSSPPRAAPKPKPATTAPSEPSAGADLKGKTTRPTRPIDEADPYQR